MRKYEKKGNTHSEKNVLSDWDPRMEDYLDRQSSTVAGHGPGSNFSRSVNLARNKEIVHEPCGVYVRNVPCFMTSESLHKLFSEHGKVLNVYTGKPRTDFSSHFTWAIIKVESMKDAMTMISALNQKPPLHFKVELSMTEEERQKRKREKIQENQHQQWMEEIVSSRLNADDCKPSTSQVDSSSRRQLKGIGRGKLLMSLKHKKNSFTDQQCGDVVPSCKHSNTFQTSLGDSLVQCTSAPDAKTKAVMKMDCGTVAVERRQPRPCICCGAQGQLRCSVCKAWYCGKLCQVDDWYYHREKCSPPPPLEDADNEFESGRNIPYCIKQNKTEDTLPSPPQMHKPKISVYESNDFLSFGPKSPRTEANVGQGNEKQDRHKNGNREQKVLENFKEQNDTNCMNHMQSVLLEQKEGLFEEKSIHKPENKMQDAHLMEENTVITENKIQDAQMIVSHKKSPNRAVDHNIRSSNHRTIRKRIIVPSTGKLRRPHHTRFIEVGQITNDDKQLSKELGTSPENTFIEVADSSPNNINKPNKCDESTQTVPDTASAIGKETCMAEDSASYANISQENSTYSSSDSESELTFNSPEEKANSIMSFGSTSHFTNFLLLTDGIKLDTICEGVITVVASYKQFTAVIKSDQTSSILGEAQEVLSNAPYDPNFKPETGSIVAALSPSDGSWYRAYVHKLVAGKYNVYYIDFGNVETIEVTKPLPAGLFSELPGFAVVAALHAEVDIKVQNQLQSIVMLNKPIAFKVVSKKSKSLKVSLLGVDPVGRVADYILRPWYSSLPLENVNSSSCMSAVGLPSRLTTEHSAQEASFQDKKGVDSVNVHCKWKSDSQSQMSPSKSAEFVSLTAKKACGINSVYPVDKLSDSVFDTEKYPENDVGELCLKSTRGAESSNGNENKNIPFPGFPVKSSENYSLCDSRTTSDTSEISKEENTEAPLYLKLPGSLPCQFSKKFWAKDLGKLEVKNGKEYTVVPVWVDDDNKLCLHPVTKKSALEYQKMTRNIIQHCETGVIPSDIQVGELVCGFVFRDGLWCRAEVISVESDHVTVYLVDFGNSDTLHKRNIREFSAKFMELPSICVRVKLLGISKDNKEARRNLQALVESQLTLKMYAQGDQNLEFELYDPQQNMFLNDMLCSCSDRKNADLENLWKGVPDVASPTSYLEQEKKDSSSTSSPSTEAIKLPFKEHCTVSRSTTSLQSSSPLHLPSPVQSSMPVELPTPEQPTTSRHTFVDAKQISSLSSGNLPSSTLPLSNPRQKCVNDKNENSDKTLISQNVNSVKSQEITDAEDSVRSTVPMYDECKTTTLPISNNVTVVVLEALNPHTIFVVPQESLHLFGDLESMMVTMNEYCNSHQGCLYRPRQGEICLAKFSQDGKWYRAACLNPGMEDALIIYIDFANTEVVLHSNILQIPKQFLELPCLALHCILDGVSTSDVKEQASVRIRELMPSNSPIVVDVLKQNEDGSYTIANSTVTNTLLSEGLVKPVL